MMRVKAVGMGFVGELDGEDTGLIEALHFDASGAMDEGCRIGVNGLLEEDTDVADLAVFMVKEEEVARLRTLERADNAAAGGLLRGVARQGLAEETHDDLYETRAIHPHGVFSAPEVGDVQEETHRLQEVLRVQIEGLGEYHRRVDAEAHAQNLEPSVFIVREPRSGSQRDGLTVILAHGVCHRHRDHSGVLQRPAISGIILTGDRGDHLCIDPSFLPIRVQADSGPTGLFLQNGAQLAEEHLGLLLCAFPRLCPYRHDAM